MKRLVLSLAAFALIAAHKPNLVASPAPRPTGFVYLGTTPDASHIRLIGNITIAGTTPKGNPVSVTITNPIFIASGPVQLWVQSWFVAK
jgi:hypothetical protein